MKFALILIALLISNFTFASVDIRMNLGKAFGEPESLNENVATPLQLNGLNILGLDVLANPTGLGGLGAGLRFDNYSNTEKDQGSEFEFSSAVLSLLLNYRIINTGLYAGPIVGIGIGHSSQVETKNSTGNSTYTADKDRSFSIGAEGGVKLGAIVLGAELGYLSFKSTEIRDGNGSYLLNTESGNKKNANFSGPYARFQIGVSL